MWRTNKHTHLHECDRTTGYSLARRLCRLQDPSMDSSDTIAAYDIILYSTLFRVKRGMLVQRVLMETRGRWARKDRKDPAGLLDCWV